MTEFPSLDDSGHVRVPAVWAEVQRAVEVSSGGHLHRGSFRGAEQGLGHERWSGLQFGLGFCA